jgi:serine/arginine repetitive matrix protein 2
LDEPKQEHLHELEREWNKPKPKAVARPSTPDPSRKTTSQSSGSRASLGNGLPRARQDSHTSLRSLDSGRSSRASSISSQMSCWFSLCHWKQQLIENLYADREQRDEIEQERNHDRERDWNRPPPRSASNLSLRSQHERVRTASNSALSIPPRHTFSLHSNDSTSSLQSQDDQRSSPGQDNQAFLSPKRLSHSDHALSLSAPSLRRQASFSSSTTSSPTGSMHSAGSGVEEGLEYEAVLERERNWNAPRPKWASYQALARVSISSAPSSPGSDHAQASEGRARTKSLTVASSSQLQARQSEERRRISPSASGSRSPLLRPPSNAHSPSPLLRAATHPPRPISPLPHSADKVHMHSKRFSAPPHPGWSFPRNRTSLPPLELEEDTVDKRVAPNGVDPTPSSYEPEQNQDLPFVRSTVFSRPKKDETGSSNGQENETKKSHRRMPAESSKSPGLPNHPVHAAGATPVTTLSNTVIGEFCCSLNFFQSLKNASGRPGGS